MELEELLKKVLDLEVRTVVAEKIADKAFDMAIDAKVELESMKKSTHKIEYVNPLNLEANEEVKKVMEEFAGATSEEEEPQVRIPLSPFGTFKGFTARREEIESSPVKAVHSDPAAEMEEALWEDSLS